MPYSPTTESEKQIAELEAQIYKSKEKLAEMKRAAPRREIPDHVLAGPNGEPVPLSALFGDKSDLVIVHNMGKGCSYCTLWADGFNGLLPHLQDRASFVVISPNDPATQREFAESRGWKFRMLSDTGSAFSRSVGYTTDDGAMPGTTTYTRDDQGRIFLVADAPFGPGDDFCSVWPLFELLAGGANEWHPRLHY